MRSATKAQTSRPIGIAARAGCSGCPAIETLLCMAHLTRIGGYAAAATLPCSTRPRLTRAAFPDPGITNALLRRRALLQPRAQQRQHRSLFPRQALDRVLQ